MAEFMRGDSPLELEREAVTFERTEVKDFLEIPD
jgi:hypothetical protein